MNLNLKKMCYVVAGVAALAGGESFGAGFHDLPVEMVRAIYSKMDHKERRNARVNCLTDDIAVDMSQGEIGIRGSKFKEKIERIETLLELDQFIEIPPFFGRTWSDWLMSNRDRIPSTAISHVGVSQELWFEVMGG